MIRAIAIDDEPPALKLIENFCNKTEGLQLLGTFTKPKEALNYLDKNPVDLLFLDIQMPSLTGIDLYKSLKKEHLVIFTTAYSEYAVEGFTLKAVDYLLKPFTYERFFQAFKQAEKEFNYNLGTKAPAYMMVKADYSLIKVDVSEISYIEGLDDYLKIHFINKKTIVTRMTMKAILESLPEKEFIRVHRSFIVPLDKIKSVRNKTIFIDSAEIPIGNSFEDKFFEFFKK
jgi:DNA-binding LytR/AlgR family response regulator